MKCPVCNVDLHMTDRSGVEIDYCPQCRGVWLDRGELDKIIERAAVQTGQPTSGATASTHDAPPYNQERRPHKDDQYKRDEHHGRDYKQHRKKSWLREIFDFD